MGWYRICRWHASKGQGGRWAVCRHPAVLQQCTAATQAVPGCHSDPPDRTFGRSIRKGGGGVHRCPYLQAVRNMRRFVVWALHRIGGGR